MLTNDQGNIRGWIGAVCFFALIVGDMSYGAINGRESLVTWVQILFGALALFALFSHQISELAISKTGVTIKQQLEKQVEVAAAVGAAAASRAQRDETPETAIAEAKAAARVVAKAVTPRVVKRLAKLTALWVDDQPDNSRYERQALESLGVHFVVSTSTAEALAKTTERKYDLIISDMGRPGDPQAGYTLLEALRSRGDRTPFIICTARTNADKNAEARKKGALGITTRSDELIQLVLSALGGRRLGDGNR